MLEKDNIKVLTSIICDATLSGGLVLEEKVSLLEDLVATLCNEIMRDNTTPEERNTIGKLGVIAATMIVGSQSNSEYMMSLRDMIHDEAVNQ